MPPLLCKVFFSFFEKQLEDTKSELQTKVQMLQDSDEKLGTIKSETSLALAAAQDAVAAAEARSMKEAEVNYFREVLIRSFETNNPSVVLPVAEKLLRYSTAFFLSCFVLVPLSRLLSKKKSGHTFGYMPSVKLFFSLSRMMFHRFSEEDKKRALAIVQREKSKKAANTKPKDLSGTVITLARNMGLQ